MGNVWQCRLFQPIFYIEWINTIDGIILKMIELHPFVAFILLSGHGKRHCIGVFERVAKRINAPQGSLSFMIVFILLMMNPTNTLFQTLLLAKSKSTSSFCTGNLLRPSDISCWAILIIHVELDFY